MSSRWFLAGHRAKGRHGGPREIRDRFASFTGRNEEDFAAQPSAHASSAKERCHVGQIKSIRRARREV